MISYPLMAVLKLFAARMSRNGCLPLLPSNDRLHQYLHVYAMYGYWMTKPQNRSSQQSMLAADPERVCLE